MNTNLIGIIFLIALVLLFGWLTRRAWGLRRRILKWPALVLSGLLTLLLAVITVVAGIGVAKTSVPVNYAVANLSRWYARPDCARRALCLLLCRLSFIDREAATQWGERELWWSTDRHDLSA